ncbi:30S ribosomal protein bS22 [Desulfobotulus pelophilus]|uniref:30S ribosomal protein bS22 n=1 Tax=Desulfobotulus pelophilus TaxID=2823377 RepID=UPI003F624B26
MDKQSRRMLLKQLIDLPERSMNKNFSFQTGGDVLGSVIKKRRKKMRRHKHRKLLARTRHQRRKK